MWIFQFSTFVISIRTWLILKKNEVTAKNVTFCVKYFKIFTSIFNENESRWHLLDLLFWPIEANHEYTTLVMYTYRTTSGFERLHELKWYKMDDRKMLEWKCEWNHAVFKVPDFISSVLGRLPGRFVQEICGIIFESESRVSATKYTCSQ